MRFYFIRHGQSVNNAIYEATGGSDGRSEDPQLTEIGQQQARLLANFLRAQRCPGRRQCAGVETGLFRLYPPVYQPDPAGGADRHGGCARH